MSRGVQGGGERGGICRIKTRCHTPRAPASMASCSTPTSWLQTPPPADSGHAAPRGHRAVRRKAGGAAPPMEERPPEGRGRQRCTAGTRTETSSPTQGGARGRPHPSRRCCVRGGGRQPTAGACGVSPMDGWRRAGGGAVGGPARRYSERTPRTGGGRRRSGERGAVDSVSASCSTSSRNTENVGRVMLHFAPSTSK